MGLPNEIASKSREKWLELASSSDPTQRKQVTDVLRACGLGSPDYMPWDAERRVNFIMDKQGAEEGGATKKKGAAAPSTSSSNGAGGGGSNAEVMKALEENTQLLRIIHDLLVVQIFSNPQVKANAEEMEIAVKLLGND